MSFNVLRKEWIKNFARNAGCWSIAGMLSTNMWAQGQSSRAPAAESAVGNPMADVTSETLLAKSNQLMILRELKLNGVEQGVLNLCADKLGEVTQRFLFEDHTLSCMRLRREGEPLVCDGEVDHAVAATATENAGMQTLSFVVMWRCGINDTLGFELNSMWRPECRSLEC